MRILVSGASGLIGSSLVETLTHEGHEVVRLARSRPVTLQRYIIWDPLGSQVDLEPAGALDAVVHLAGETIATRWTAEQKAKIRDSRVNGTRILCEGLSRLDRPPQTFISASAVGYYGDRGDVVLTEDSAPGSGFLADVCRAWEAASAPALRRGLRVAHLRFGMILSRAGGALAKLLLPFRFGLGGPIGSGNQYMSWLSLTDAVGAIQHVLASRGLHGPINAVAPDSVTNREFTKTLGGVLHRPTVLPLPAAAARLVLGEMADELLLASTRVEPTRLLASNYRFAHPGLKEALRAEIKGKG